MCGAGSDSLRPRGHGGVSIAWLGGACKRQHAQSCQAVGSRAPQQSAGSAGGACGHTSQGRAGSWRAHQPACRMGAGSPGRGCCAARTGRAAGGRQPAAAHPPASQQHGGRPASKRAPTPSRPSRSAARITPAGARARAAPSPTSTSRRETSWEVEQLISCEQSVSILSFVLCLVYRLYRLYRPISPLFLASPPVIRSDASGGRAFLLGQGQQRHRALTHARSLAAPPGARLFQRAQKDL